MKKQYLSITAKLCLVLFFASPSFSHNIYADNLPFTAPVFTNVPETITVECQDIPVAVDPTVTDECEGAITIQLTESVLPINNGCDGKYNLKRTWTATNDCGDQTVASQTIKVRDKTPAELSGIPENITVACGEVSEPANVTAFDLCSGVITPDYEEEQIFLEEGCSGKYNLKRTWTAIDGCGNKVSKTQTIRVRDKEPAVLTGIPENITVTCDQIPDAPTVTALDACAGEITAIGYTEETIEVNNSCSGKYNLKRTWTATDGCGNTVTGSQLIKVRDTNPPVLAGIPEAITVECDQIPEPAEVMASSGCGGNVTLEYIEETIEVNNRCSGKYNLRRTWRATDDCGRVTIAKQVIKVRDLSPTPELVGVPADATITCEAVVGINDIEVTATNKCGGTVDIVSSEVRIDGDCSDSYTLTRTWTATNDCGETAIQSQILTVIDEVAPVFGELPADVTVDCNAIPAAATVIATDNCDIDVEIAFSEILIDFENCPHKQNIRRVWTATDNCGNQITHTQVVKVRDNDGPVFDAIPENITVDCQDIPAEPTITATDNCDAPEAIIITLNEEIIPIEGACENNYRLKRTWTATDACGNATSASQIIRVNDKTDPVLSEIPANIRVDCDAIPDPIEVTATDNCDGEVVITLEETILPLEGACANNYNLKRTWTATDACGNTANGSRILRVRDNSAPVTTCEPDALSMRCTGALSDINLDNWNTANIARLEACATDNCGNVTVTSDFNKDNFIASCGNAGTLPVIFTIADDCGNSTTISSGITIIDETAPDLSATPDDLTTDCDNVPVMDNLTAIDGCDGNLEVTQNEVRTDGDCPSNYTLTRTWSVTDACDNTTTHTQTVTVQDITAPVLPDAPADVTLFVCSEVPAPVTLTATDACFGTIEVTPVDVRTDGKCLDVYTITRTWTATDDCGNTSTVTQTINFDDTDKEILSDPPADVTVECDAVPAMAILEAADNCRNPKESIGVEEIIAGDCAGNYTIERSWVYTDDCGNSERKFQTVTVQDTKAPVLSAAPDDVTIECDAIPDVAVLTATDNCTEGAVDVTLTEVRTDGNCTDNYTLTRTWTAADDCGNAASVSQIIRVQNTAGSILSDAPADISVDCGNIPDAAVLIAADNCTTDVEVTAVEVRTDGDCAGNYTLTRTWTWTNDCGTTDTKTQIISVEDTTAPTLSCEPNTLNARCFGELSASNFGDSWNTTNIAKLEACATDNCGNVTVTSDYDKDNFIPSCGNAGTLRVIFTIADDCGNSTTISGQIIMIDETAPELSATPDDITVDCDDVPAMDNLTAIDGCAGTLEVAKVEVRTEGDCPNNYILTRTWSVTDACDNTTTHIQTVTVQDTKAPELSATPADVTVECDAVPDAAVLTATDNCSQDLTVEFTESDPEEVNEGSDCIVEITRTWTVEDACGNSTSHTQKVRIEDTTAPEMEVPADVTVDCGNIPEAPFIEAADNCYLIPVDVVETITPGDCGGSYTITRTWTANDFCGNVTIKAQVITIQDNTAPVLSDLPADETVECSEDLEEPTITATDACQGTIEVIYKEGDIEGNCEENYTIIRTWTATDACDNTVTHTQTVTVKDTKAPILSETPGDVTAECGSLPDAPTITATDNCDDELTVTLAETTTDGTCAGSYTLTRTWSVSDDCGNTTTHNQTISVSDNIKPVLSGVPADTIVSCEAIPAASTVTANDICDGDLTVEFNESTVDGDCSNSSIITRTWTATDACGNSIIGTQIMTVKDTTAPVLSEMPADVTVECDAIPAVPLLTARDNCGGSATVIFTGTGSSVIATNLNGFQLVRTWTASDNCGNTTAHSQIITVADNTAPVIDNMPSDTTVNCDGIPVALQLTGTDNCDNNVTMDLEEITSEGDCNYTITRTWTATDDSGNVKKETQIITVQDTTAPVLTNVPTNVTVSCNEIPEPVSPTSLDNCAQNVMLSLNEVTSEGDCNYTITRTWTATDACGNSTQAVQVITVVDDIDPVLTDVPFDITVDCDAIPDPALLTVSDNCSDNATIGYGEIRTDGNCANNYTLTRTWTATDLCDNTIIETQIITVQDTSKPIISGVPADVMVTCEEIPVAATPTVNDNCEEAVNLSFSETSTTVDCAGGYTITRTWTATDACGNQTVENQAIFVQDIIIPNREYCPTAGRNTNYFWIRHVGLGDIANETGSDGGYGDYSDLSTGIVPGGRYDIILSPGYRRYYYYVNWTVWIDFNQDGDFEDADERLFTRRTASILKASNFRMPDNFLPGVTKMRVSMKYGNPARPCESFSYGEVEDYTINLLSPNTAREPLAAGRNQDQTVQFIEMGPKHPVRELNIGLSPALTIFPNPVRQQLTVQLSDYQQEEAKVRIYNQLGQTVYEAQIDNQSAQQFSIDVQDFKDGVYFLSIQNEQESPLVQKFQKN